LVKVYPVLFAPLVVRYLWDDRRLAIRFCVAYAATCSLALTPLLAGADWQAVWGPYKFQLTREPEHGLTIYGCVLPVDLAHGALGALFRLTCLAGIMALSLATPIRDLNSLLRRCAAVLMIFVSLAIFYSPQWILWFAPLLLPLLRRQHRLGWSIAALDLFNYATFPFWFWVFPSFVKQHLSPDDTMQLLSQAGNLLRLGRFLTCALILRQLLYTEYPWQQWINGVRTRIPSWRTLFAPKYERPGG
jgi:hypothetical protein